MISKRLQLTDNTARWAFVIAAGLLATVGLWALRVTVVADTSWQQFARIVMLLAFAAVYGAVRSRMPRLAVPTAVASDLLLSTSQLLAMMLVFLPLSYLAAVPSFPLLDADLTRLDAMLFSFEWDAAARWVANRPMLDQVLQWAYVSAMYQTAVVLLIGSITRPGDRNGDFIWQFGISSLIVCVFFVFTPALGKIGHVGTDYIDTLITLRSGLWTVLDFSRAEGIVTFPSFHTTLAILFVYAVRQYRWASAIFIPLNILMIGSTLTVGGHYLVDLPAGAAVALAAIASTRVLRRRLHEFASIPLSLIPAGILRERPI